MMSSPTFVRRIVGVALMITLSGCSGIGLPEGQREFSGVWLYEFEGSSFVEGATAVPTVRPDYETTDWLEYPSVPPGALRDIQAGLAAEGLECQPVQAFRVRFTGRRTRHPPGTGHLGLWRTKVTVERTLAIERLGPPFCYEPAPHSGEG